jgi:hypothetical protein
MTGSAVADEEANGTSVGEGGRIAAVPVLDGGRELIDKMGCARDDLEVCRWTGDRGSGVHQPEVVYADGGSKEMFARRLHFDGKAEAIQCLVEMRELDTTSPEARACEMLSHNWNHAGGVREGDVFVQRQRCERCLAERRLRISLIDGELLSTEQ